MSIVDRFLYKLFFMAFLLFAVVLMDRVGVLKINKIKEPLSENVNILKVISSINGKLNLVVVDLEDEMSVSGEIVKTEKMATGLRVKLGTYEAVESLSLGTVVRIDKKDVYILGQNDTLYCYKNLDNIDVSLYEIIRKNHIIGKANRLDDENFYDVIIIKNNKMLDYIP